MEIKKYLDTQYIGKKIIYFDSINSTNKYAKEIARSKEEGTLIIADHQSSGKGRLGRDWTSPYKKGIYFSIILKPKLNPKQVARVTLIGAAALYLALKDMDIDSQIKWPNDIVIAGKKVAGILTEMSSDLNTINYIVIGIGINANLDKEDFPQDLKDKASSLKILTGREIVRNRLLGLFLNHFEKLYNPFKEGLNIVETIDICRQNSALIGKEIKIIIDGNIRTGMALDISHEGDLIIQFEDGIERIDSGEVSVRGLNKYI